ncbi:MAG TPA: VOC family protein [Euzebyales bacterium]|nr:VOC family protein [Euzebyales bacterium]
MSDPTRTDEAAIQAKERRRREDLLAGLRLEARLREANPPTPVQAEEERRRRYDRIAGLVRQAEDGVPDTSYIDDATMEVLRTELARLERRGPHAASPLAAGAIRPLITPARTNTILYCRRWRETIAFYRDELGLAVLADHGWFVELAVTSGTSLSVADATRTTIDGVDGQGITLSWQVTDLGTTRNRLLQSGLAASEVRSVGDAVACYLTDPEGHRIEIWSDGSEP